MIRINIDISDHFQEFNEEFSAACQRALERVGQKCEEYAQDLCPVDTGNLRNSINHQVHGDESATVGTNVEYGMYVELGTGKYATGGGGRPTPWVYQDGNGEWHHTHGQQAQPFLKPAATKHTDTYKNIIDSELRRLCKKSKKPACLSCKNARAEGR